MINKCDHSIFNGEGCYVIYDGHECPMCILKRKTDIEKEVHRIELSFKKLKDGTCDIFADIYSLNNVLQLTAEQVKFTKVRLFSTDNTPALLNIPYETLKKFAEDVLNEKV